MLVLKKISGYWNGTKFEFSARERVLFRGSLAWATGGGGQSTAETVPTGPWAQQIPFINRLFQEAGGLLNAGPPGYYPGQTVLPPPASIPQTQATATQQVGANAPVNAGVAGTAANVAQGAFQNPVAQAGQNLNPLLQMGIGDLIAGGGPLAGTGGLLPGVSGAINRVTGQAEATPGQTPTVGLGNIDYGGELGRSLQGGALNPFLDQIIQGSLRTSNQQFRENVLPGLRDEAAAAGQVGGTRAGIAEGIAGRGLADQQNDLIARIMSTAFESGAAERGQALGLTGQTALANQGANLQQQQINEMLRSGRIGEILNAAQIGGGLATAGAQLGQQGQIAGTQQAGNLLTQGQNIGTNQLTAGASILPALQGTNLQQQGFLNELGLQQYGFDQAARDADVERYFYEAFAPYNLLTQYQNYISGPYGSSIAGRPNVPGEQSTIFPATTPGVAPPGQLPYPWPGYNPSLPGFRIPTPAYGG